MMKLLPLVVAAFVSACAVTPQYWYKRGATQRDFDVAMARCRMQAAGIQPTPRTFERGAGATVVNAGKDLEDAATHLGFMNDCLTASGWHR